MHCTRCGADVETQYRFCPQCGLRLADARDTAPLSGERKLVTVLFCDLTGSTALAEQLDAEDYSDVLDEYIQRAFAEVYRFDGFVNQLAGDGFMAMFGAPVAHEDAPERAVRAALAVQRALADMAERRTPLRARIGIHTGPVVVGTVGTDRRMDYTAIGDTTNLAARLEQTAGPGTILMSDATQRLVHGRFHVEETGPLALKGKADAVVAYRVLGESGVVDAIELAAARGLTPFVGRKRELAQIEDAFQRACAGHRQIVAVVGGAGSGKSRLVYEFQRRHDGERVTFFEGRCVAIEQAIPFHPLVHMFRRHFGIRPGDTLDEALERVRCHESESHGKVMEDSAVERMLTGFLVDPTRAPGNVAADEVKRVVFDAVEHGIRGHAELGPTVIVVEDYHFIDEVSQELIEHLARRLHDCRVLLLVTHRPKDGMEGPKKAGIIPVALERMADHEITLMVRAVAGAPLAGDLEERIVRRAAGSPFFAEELVRALVEGGALVVRDGVTVPARPIEDIPIPDTVQEVIAARLDRLPPPVKRVAQVASVFGRDVVPHLLLQVLDGEDIDVPAALVTLERRGLLHRKGVGEATLRFGESLTQEVAYEGLLVKQRRVLHERIATVLESAGGGQDVLLAYHYARSENRPKAVAALLAAGAAAERVPAYDVSARLYRQALDLGEQELAAAPSVEMERAVYTAVSALIRFLAMFGLGEVAHGEALAQRARALALRLGEERTAPTLAYFEAVIAMMQGREHYPRGLAQAEEAFAYAQRVGYMPTMLSVARGLCLTYIVDGRVELARRTVDWIISEAARLSPADRPSDFQLAVEWLLSVVMYAAEDFDGSMQQARYTHERALQFENRTLQCVSASTLAQIFLLRGVYDEAEEWADTSLVQAERMGNLAAFVPSASVALVARHMLGRPVDPTPYVDLIERGLRASGPTQVSFRFAPEALLLPGTPAARATELIQHMYRLAGGRLREAIASVGWAGVLRSRSETSAEAERLYHHALAQAEAVGARSVAAEATVGLAETLAARGDELGAAREAARARPAIEALRLGHFARRLARLAPAERVAHAGA